MNKARKRDLTVKKMRKIYINEMLTLKLLVRNPLMADIVINHIKIICRFEGEEDSKDEEVE